MMSLAAIRDLSAQAGRRARRHRKTVMVFNEVQRLMLANGDWQPMRCIPNLGDYRPKVWKLVATHFVHKSGYGRDDEPAMSAYAFAKNVGTATAAHGWRIIEEGQFQCYVGEFEQKE